MEKKVLQSIAGVEIYPLVSLAIFVLFFLGLLLFVVRANRHHLSRMSELPLVDENEEDQFLKAHLEHDVLC